MPNFEVQCAFQCVKCRKMNVKIVVVAATDENEARELALGSTTCKRCGPPYIKQADLHRENERS
jgi:predicted nucleic-acid-binding Zn-ribbon protein